MLRVGPRDLGTGKPPIEAPVVTLSCRWCGKTYEGGAPPSGCPGYGEGEARKPCPVASNWPNHPA